MDCGCACGVGPQVRSTRFVVRYDRRWSLPCVRFRMALYNGTLTQNVSRAPHALTRTVPSVLPFVLAHVQSCTTYVPNQTVRPAGLTNKWTQHGTQRLLRPADLLKLHVYTRYNRYENNAPSCGISLSRPRSDHFYQEGHRISEFFSCPRECRAAPRSIVRPQYAQAVRRCLGTKRLQSSLGKARWAQ